MAAYDESCSSQTLQSTSSESEPMLRLFCTYENLTRFVMPLCSAVRSRPEPHEPITDTLCIVDVSEVSFMQFWRLRSHLQAASTLASSHYPETLGKTYVSISLNCGISLAWDCPADLAKQIIGAPSFFPTIWSWISKWFHPNTVAKIRIVPQGKELSMLSEIADPINIPQKYGGKFDFNFGQVPDLDPEIKNMVTWLKDDQGNPIDDMPKGPLRWVERGDELRTAIAVGAVEGTPRNTAVMALRS